MASANPSVRATVVAATGGDERAWNELVARFTPVLRRVAKGYRLSPEDVDDVIQLSWVALLENLPNLREPEAIGAWLVTTARRVAFRIRQHDVREVPTEFPFTEHLAAPDCCETAIIDRERMAALRQAVRRLPSRQRELVEALLDAPGSSYRDVSQGLGIPVGSIGPTRERGLDRLRRDAQLARVLAP
ncbi:MAG TPA: sigma-70 family RNA polymerase sigma factor [Solirubrobacter sp.]|nr:sigma-70 family RNA polymerase sigma factor [Solirubrobacter sp.]